MGGTEPAGPARGAPSSSEPGWPPPPKAPSHPGPGAQPSVLSLAARHPRASPGLYPPTGPRHGSRVCTRSPPLHSLVTHPALCPSPWPRALAPPPPPLPPSWMQPGLPPRAQVRILPCAPRVAEPRGSFPWCTRPHLRLPPSHGAATRGPARGARTAPPPPVDQRLRLPGGPGRGRRGARKPLRRRPPCSTRALRAAARVMGVDDRQLRPASERSNVQGGGSRPRYWAWQRKGNERESLAKRRLEATSYLQPWQEGSANSTSCFTLQGTVNCSPLGLPTWAALSRQLKDDRPGFPWLLKGTLPSTVIFPPAPSSTPPRPPLFL